MGVSGGGKTTIGRALTHRLGMTFLDGDDFHPPENIQKMHQQIALNDTDRQPWLTAIRLRLGRLDNAVLGCSALKQSYRQTLNRERPDRAVSRATS